MDLAFIRGSATNNTQTNKNDRIITSRDGYTAYLIIIDAATRYIWTFYLKNKQAPLTIIDSFLEKHGRKHNGIITTHTKGILAKSRSFKTTCTERGYQVTPHDVDIINTAIPNVIRTDGGGEFDNEELDTIIAKHGYIHEHTAPDSSNSNGMAERPNRTLKERTRCLLYAAGLGTEFWADALAHAVWLYNRTYHSAIDMTPYQAYTHRTPTLDGLLTFGCKITPRKTGKRRHALDSHHFDGIFLGYRSTMDHIKYWDIKAQRCRTAKHATVDELQYGYSPDQRNAASKHLIEQITGVDHRQKRTDILHDNTNGTCLQDTPTVPYPTDCNQTTIDDSPLPYTASAAKTKVHTTPLHMEQLTNELQQFDIVLDMYEPSVIETIPINGTHPTLGLVVNDHPEYDNLVQFTRCDPGTSAHKNLRNWKSRFRGAVIRMIDDITITNRQHLAEVIQHKRLNRQQVIQIQFAHTTWHHMDGKGTPILQFDQLNVVHHHLRAINTGHTTWKDPLEWPPISVPDVLHAIHKGLAIPKLTRRKVKQQPDWQKFLESEWVQLNKYYRQGMFAEPQPRPKDPNTIVLPWVWSYIYKTHPVTLEQQPKSRGTCDGSKRRINTLAETYASCVEQPAHRLTWAIIAALNYVALGCDIGNAFAEADGPKQQFYMQVDDQFHDWWTQHLKKPPIPKGYVIPILRNLQGHPEGPRLWDKHISKLVRDQLGFQPTTHEPCLYYRHDEQDGLILILRQVDDFLIAAKNIETCQRIRHDIQQLMKNPLNDLGIIKRFNGIDTVQTKHYIKIHGATYITKIIEHHGWQNEKAANLPIPMRTDSAYQAQIQLEEGPTDPQAQKELEKQMGFNYRQAIGELIFAMTICRIDISIAVIILSQYSHNPAKIHYQALKAVFVYLNATKEDGIYYWRPAPRDDLPDIPLPNTISESTALQHYLNFQQSTDLKGATDATWASDRKHRKSMGGVVFMLAGGAVYYRSRLHPTIALSSTESEFASMVDAGKAALYLRSILEEIGIKQIHPTPILIDNQGAQLMANAQRPTRRTRHVECNQFVILEWTENEQITYEPCKSEHNISDSLSKPTARIKHYIHHDIMMGRRQPDYARIPPLLETKTTI